jgi:endogenous inhibitor of DNA gyrase (YacG/DUF329 family)
MRYRCFNPNCTGKTGPQSQHEFSAAERKCPICKASGPVIVPVLVHHFLLPDSEGKISGHLGCNHRVACNPSLTLQALSARVQMTTADAFATNCPACLATPEWKEAARPVYEKLTSGLCEDFMTPNIPDCVHTAMKGAI